MTRTSAPAIRRVLPAQPLETSSAAKIVPPKTSDELTALRQSIDGQSGPDADVRDHTARDPDVASDGPATRQERQRNAAVQFGLAQLRFLLDRQTVRADEVAQFRRLERLEIVEADPGVEPGRDGVPCVEGDPGRIEVEPAGGGVRRVVVRGPSREQLLLDKVVEVAFGPCQVSERTDGDRPPGSSEGEVGPLFLLCRSRAGRTEERAGARQERQ